MRVLNKKVKAFTIAEMLVVLVISGIVISLTMLVLTLVQKQLNIINSNNERRVEVELLERTLSQDFNRHSLFFNIKDQRLQCVSAVDTVNYIFENEYVIRNLDTLKVPVVKIVTYLDGTVASNNHLDAMEVQLSKEIKDKKLFIYKTNDALFYMK